MVFMFFPQKKLYWDEPFSIMCSKGFSWLNIEQFLTQKPITSTALNNENTLRNIYYGGDSVYYFGLHYFSLWFNNTINSYLYFSVVWGILTLIAFYFLARQLLGDTLYTSLALLLLVTDFQFLGQTYCIRNYMISLFFVILATIYFFRYLHVKNFKNIFWLGMLSELAFLSHYFTGYIVLVFGFVILYNERLAFFNKRNILALLLPVVIMTVYFATHKTPFGGFNTYQTYVKNYQQVNLNISVFTTFSLFLKSVAIDFKLLLPLFRDTFLVRAVSAGVVFGLFFYGRSLCPKGSDERRIFNLLFILGFAANVFIGFLAYKAGHQMLFSFRYFLFSIPFCALFMTLFLKKITEQSKLNPIVKVAIYIMLLWPATLEFVFTRMQKKAIPCNHIEVAATIVKKDVHSVAVPDLSDAIFLHCMMPVNYEISYYLNPDAANDVILYKAGREERVHIIKNGLIALY